VGASATTTAPSAGGAAGGSTNVRAICLSISSFPPECLCLNSTILESRAQSSFDVTLAKESKLGWDWKPNSETKRAFGNMSGSRGSDS
jgi:hypothetical protein